MDSSLAFKSEGYAFIGNRCQQLGSDIFEARLLGKRYYCTTGSDAARMFYTPGRFTREGGLPVSTLKLLQDEGSVAVLDGDAHRRRKAMMLSLMTPARLDEMAALAAERLRAAARGWQGGERVRLHDAFRRVLGGAVCAWAGVPVDAERLESLTGEIGAMIDNAGTVGPQNWKARSQRRRAEKFLNGLVEDVRQGESMPPPASALAVIAAHKDGEGELLPPAVAAVEMLNILRPTVAIARFMTFAVLALYQHPETRDLLAGDDHYVEAFVQEVRRLSPFFPVVAGVAKEPFTWRDHHFEAGDRFILDLYGTDRDGRAWDDPESFRPERFLRWPGDAFTMIPQGGGDHLENHRCAGEWLTIAVMKSMLRVLTREIDYDVPGQDLSVDLSQLPALPKSGFVISVKAVGLRKVV
ncbi:MAG TPA: cytochrome P450 [Pseudolabrys sp.]|nr:cytochrome P450 [Pseudolabrys sp.]